MVEGEGEILLRREEMLLRGRGEISFGHAREADPVLPLTFACIDSDSGSGGPRA